jgi:PPM family protein phosphatase
MLPSTASTAPFDVRIEFGAWSDIGKVRPTNQDQYLVARLRKSVDVLAASLPPEQCAPLVTHDGYLFLVADGMGGRAGGDRASSLVVQEAITHVVETAKWFFRLDDPDEEVRLRLLRESLEKVDRKLIEEGKNDPALAGMGTTLTALSVLGADGFIVHVGDSRAYLFRAGALEQLTRDHTMVQELVRQGLISSEDARTHRLRHVLTNVLGGVPGVAGEIVKLRLADGDRVLLCTDGLHGSVPDDQIGEILGSLLSPEEACRDLVEAALSRGGRDNVTAVVGAISIHEARP